VAPVRHLFLQLQHISIDADGTTWIPSVYGIERSDGMWEAWIEFRPLDDQRPRATDRETTQPNRQAVEYWATGLEPLYFEGAFARAVDLPT
jgi:hypothetical protein